MLDTKVEGSPAAVATAATWLRDTLAVQVAAAGDQQQDARNDARGGWEGETASSYQNVSGDVLRATDTHEERIRTAANVLDDYAAQLKDLEVDMRSIRGRASSGGLTVVGTVIHPPPEVPGATVEPGSPEEAAHHTAVARVELWNTLVEDAAADYEAFTSWVDSTMPGHVADAREKDGSDTVFDAVVAQFPNFAAGAGAGLNGVALTRLADGFTADAREFRRRSRVSGDPRVRGQADTPGGRATLDDLLGKAGRLGRLGRVVGGPAGIAIDVGFGIKDGVQTGNWERAGLTTGTSIAVGVGAAVVLGTVGAPALVVVLGAGAAAAVVSAGVGYVYDNWDDITDSVGDAWDGATDAVGDAWDSATDTVGDAWDSVTPW